MPRAIAEGWTERRLAEEANVGVTAARSALNRKLEQVSAETAEAEGELLAMMQKEATKARAATLRRLARVASLVDRVADRLDKDLDVAEPGTDKYGNEVHCSPGLAKAALTLAQASERLWSVVKDASGTAFAEDAAKVALKSGAKVKKPLVATTVVELDSSGSRDDGES